METDRKRMSEYFSSSAEHIDMPSRVYHYCSVETFFKMISTSSIRLSNIAKSNDSEELIYIKPFLCQVVKQMTLIYNNMLPKDYRIAENTIDYFIDESFNELSKSYYVACFSQERSLLSQWARYGENAMGISIGFNTDEFVRLQVSPYTGFVFGKIVYDTSQIGQVLENIFKKEIEPSWINGNDSYNQSLVINCISSIVSTMSYYSALYKNPFFLEEREWRLIYNPFGRIRKIKDSYRFLDRINDINQDNVIVQGFKRKSIESEYRNHDICSYVDLDFSLIKQSLIKEIIIGPASKLDIYDKDLIMFLNSNGYTITDFEGDGTVKVTKINAPYRPS